GLSKIDSVKIVKPRYTATIQSTQPGRCIAHHAAPAAISSQYTTGVICESSKTSVSTYRCNDGRCGDGERPSRITLSTSTTCGKSNRANKAPATSIGHAKSRRQARGSLLTRNPATTSGKKIMSGRACVASVAAKTP